VLTNFPSPLSRPSILLLVTSLLSLPFGAVWEEIAWRAFALRGLENHYSRLVAALIIGVYWAAWHIPLWLATLNYLTIKLLLLACLNLIAWSIMFSVLYDRSEQSLPVTILLHGTYFTIQSLVFAAIPYSNIHLIPIAALLSVCLAAISARTLVTSPQGSIPKHPSGDPTSSREQE
jgi:membrane protease YdiL (CAAX protease family)